VSGDPQPAIKRAKTVTGQRKPRRFKELISPPIVDSGIRRFILQGQKKGARNQELAGTYQSISLKPKPLVILPELAASYRLLSATLRSRYLLMVLPTERISQAFADRSVPPVFRR
jgi:hypothetical protein